MKPHPLGKPNPPTRVLEDSDPMPDPKKPADWLSYAANAYWKEDHGGEACPDDQVPTVKDIADELRVRGHVADDTRERLTAMLELMDTPGGAAKIEQLLLPPKLTPEQALRLFGMQAFGDVLHGVDLGQPRPDAMQDLENVLGDSVGRGHPVHTALELVADKQGGLSMRQIRAVQLILTGLWPRDDGKDVDLLQYGVEGIHRLWASIPSENDSVKNPVGPLVRQWQRRPVHAEANLRYDRILPGVLAQVPPTDRRAGGLFSVAARRSGQLVLPGSIEQEDINGPALPLVLYQLGEDNPHRGGGRGAPLALRLFVEAVLATSQAARREGQPVALQIPLRELLARLYPGPRRPKPNEYWPRLMRAVEALDMMDARIPWVDPKTGRGELRRVVSVGGIPRGPDALDDVVRVVVDLPPGSGDGPIVTPTLGVWGARSGPAYNALLNLAYRWFDPGVTRVPVGRGHWRQVEDLSRYPELTDADVVAVTRPLSARGVRRLLVKEGWETLRALEAAGELRIRGRRVLPPARAD